MTSSTIFTSFAQVAEHLDRLGHFRIRPDFERIRSVLQRLDLLRLRCPVAQVVGTNGKGSTTTFLASLALAHGHKTGMFLSPHFVSFRERVRVNGAMLPEQEWPRLANRIMDAGGRELTYFEFLTAIAALAFAEARVDLAVMETGLGGSWDAVTALGADIVLFTPISFDHCHILGETITAIATDKAGAIRPGKPVVTAPQEKAALRVLSDRASRQGSFLSQSKADGVPESILNGKTPMRLGGRHQFTNAALALDGWRMLAQSQGWSTREAAELRGLAQAFIPGRLQFVPAAPEHGHPAMLLDGAHNVHGMAALGEALAERHIAPAAVIFACLRDKSPADVAAHLRVLSTGPVFVPPIPHNPRAMPPEELAAAIGLAATPVKDMREALALAAAHVAERMPREAAGHPQRHPVLLCGSLYLMGEFFALRPDCLEG